MGQLNRPALVKNDRVWNLAIGSNMSMSKMRNRAPKGRKQIEPIGDGIPAFVEDWSLSFDYRSLPPMEPAMAAAVPTLKGKLHGVLYCLSNEDYQSLALSEGCGKGLAGGYMEVSVRAHPYSQLDGVDTSTEGIECTVFALRDVPPTPLRHESIYPSKRYLNLLISGAKESKLDREYIEYLETYPVAREVTHQSMLWLSRISLGGIFTLLKLKTSRKLVGHLLVYGPSRMYGLRERAHAENRSFRESLQTVLMVVSMFPAFLIGFVSHKIGYVSLIGPVGRGDRKKD